MPNWTTNDLMVEGPAADIAQFYKTMINDEGDFDFNGVIPMPEAIRGTHKSTAAEIGLTLVGAIEQKTLERPSTFQPYYSTLVVARHEAEPFWITAMRYLDENPTAREEGEAALLAKVLTGYTNWYDWSVDHWGVKWNACRTELFAEELPVGATYVQVRFETPWGPPEPVYEALMNCFPTLTFEVEWQDEGDWNTHTQIYHKGA